ncbi:MAG: DUF262 domain-containing protein [Selenomonadaceae bacterium]|nr:DUF262 domain-containing protein [Selenomonadaceae bacterium]
MGWETRTVDEVISKIRGKKFVLPVIQRRLVWREDAMAKLFDTLLKGYSFGAIIILKERAERPSLFAAREFSCDGDPRTADLLPQETILQDEQFFVIDGQQRLQSFYIGLCGSSNMKLLYFDLFSDFQKSEYDFKFMLPERNRTFGKNIERGQRVVGEGETEPLTDCLWFSVKELYDRLTQAGGNCDRIADEIIREYEIDDVGKQKHISSNVSQFQRTVFDLKNVGISEIELDYAKTMNDNRQRLVELFRRLNSGGTALSTMDLVASRLKGFDSRMEEFLDNMSRESGDIRITQDELIKLIMTLQDKPLSEVTDLDDDGGKFASFALENAAHISATLVEVREFLRRTKDYNWFALNRSRSPIPIYLLAYHIFYNDPIYDNFADMKRWIKLSMLNGIFRRGCGWTPSERGMRELHTVLKDSRGQTFPTDNLFDVCKNNLHSFYAEVNAGNLDEFNRDRDYMFYLMYNGEPLSQGIVNHIQPRKTMLELIGRVRNSFTEEMIESIANLHLLSREDVKEKSKYRLKDWISAQSDKRAYLAKHLIPEDEKLWRPNNFRKFLQARAELVAARINDNLR